MSVRARPLALLILGFAVLLSGACSRASGGDSSRPPLGNVAGPGCGPSSTVTMSDDNKPPITGFRGPSTKGPLTGLAVTWDDARVQPISAMSPPTSPPSTTLKASLLTAWADGPTKDTRFVQVFAQGSVDGLNIWEILDAGGWIVSEGPIGGGNAPSVKAALDAVGNGGQSATVEIGPNQGLLVHQDAVGSLTSRPYGLYWSDGVRDVSIQAETTSDAIVTFARSMYCVP